MIAAFPEAKRRVPALRMVVVAGPAHRPDSLPCHEGLEVRPFVHPALQHLAACDPAVSGRADHGDGAHGDGRPFLFFPLRHHFEQTSTSGTGSSATARGGR